MGENNSSNSSDRWPVFRATDMKSLTTHDYIVSLTPLNWAFGIQIKLTVTACYTQIINKPHTLVPHFTHECVSSEHELTRQNTRKSPATADRTLFDVTSLSPRAENAHAHVCTAAKVLLSDSRFIYFFLLNRRDVLLTPLFILNNLSIHLKYKLICLSSFKCVSSLTNWKNLIRLHIKSYSHSF